MLNMQISGYWTWLLISFESSKQEPFRKRSVKIFFEIFDLVSIFNLSQLGPRSDDSVLIWLRAAVYISCDCMLQWQTW